MKNNKIILVAVSLLVVMASCKKDFLEEKRDLTGINEEVYKDPAMAKAYVDYIYGLFMPGSKAQSLTWELAANGSAFSQTTEEFAGETNWNKEWPTISYINAHALPYFGTRMSSSVGNNTWTRIKQINLFLSEIDKHGLPEEMRKELKGQVLFWRAWQYFDLVRLYGGVPLVLEPQNPVQANQTENEVPRSKSSEVIEQVVKDLDAAASMLPGKWASSSDWGRITSGAAAALKGRVLLTWASPLFNRADDKARWQRAYDANLAAKQLLEANGFGLYKSGGTANGTAWENMFIAQEVNNPEAVIVYGFNNVVSDQVQKWNGWENAARPKEANGGGSLSPTKQMVDAFPMKDGKMAGQSTYTYDAQFFYKNRDPRFYKTFAYNGALWPYKENTKFRVWSYKWFAKASDATPSSTTEQRGANSSGIYLRKATNPNASISAGNFDISGTDYMEMRFAEVILNLAESAIGADKLSEGLDLIKLVRERAGVENKDGAYGLSDATTRDQLFAAVLNERKIEFAYEGKRFWDLRRWLLFTDEFGTTARLGVQPINGMRRTGYFIYVVNSDGSKYVGANNEDPLYKAQYTANTTKYKFEREPLVLPAGVPNQDAYVDTLYKNVFKIVEKNDLDRTNPATWSFKWYKEYYFFGLNNDALSTSPYLEQTKGWDGIKGSGTFDPLQ
ncbi:MAG TPA: RagB/SusD family nutrient uptake outer membrane protein [Chitinophagaceae bacterium]